MYIVAIGWVYVVLMMAVAEATSTQGTVLGAVFTFLLYGVLPLSIVLYLMGTPGRRKARQAAEAAADATEAKASAQPDGSGHAPSDAVAAEREKP
jgi:mannose/fructose/N-acetylgalactosamine-specific phosphotransferase system component IID